jgi:hypothetical protein
MKIKERLAQEIEAAKRGLSIVNILTELELSKTRPDHFQKKINDIQDEMTKYRIPKNWIGDGCNDIMRTIWHEGLTVDENDKVSWTEEVSWMEKVIEANLNDRPEDEVWREVKWFLQKYFLILEYKKYIEIKTSKKQPREINPDLKLADVLIEGLSADYVKSLYKGNTYKELSMVLIYLNNLKYFKKALKEPALNMIGKNSFDPDFNFRRENKPPANPQDYPLLKHIPTDPKSLIKS